MIIINCLLFVYTARPQKTNLTFSIFDPIQDFFSFFALQRVIFPFTLKYYFKVRFYMLDHQIQRPATFNYYLVISNKLFIHHF